MPRTRRQTKVQSQNQSQDDDNRDRNEEAPPLHFPRPTRVLDALVQLHVAGLGVLLHVVGVLFCLLDGLILEDDGGGEVFHELVELDDGAFDFLDVVMAGAHGAEDRVGGCGAVGFELLRMFVRTAVLVISSLCGLDTHRCLKHALVAPIRIYRFMYLRI